MTMKTMRFGRLLAATFAFLFTIVLGGGRAGTAQSRTSASAAGLGVPGIICDAIKSKVREMLTEENVFADVQEPVRAEVGENDFHLLSANKIDRRVPMSSGDGIDFEQKYGMRDLPSLLGLVYERAMGGEGDGEEQKLHAALAVLDVLDGLTGQLLSLFGLKPTHEEQTGWRNWLHRVVTEPAIKQCFADKGDLDLLLDRFIFDTRKMQDTAFRMASGSLHDLATRGAQRVCEDECSSAYPSHFTVDRLLCASGCRFENQASFANSGLRSSHGSSGDLQAMSLRSSDRSSDFGRSPLPRRDFHLHSDGSWTERAGSPALLNSASPASGRSSPTPWEAFSPWQQWQGEDLGSSYGSTKSSTPLDREELARRGMETPSPLRTPMSLSGRRADLQAQKEYCAMQVGTLGTSLFGTDDIGPCLHGIAIRRGQVARPAEANAVGEKATQLECFRLCILEYSKLQTAFHTNYDEFEKMQRAACQQGCQLVQDDRQNDDLQAADTRTRVPKGQPKSSFLDALKKECRNHAMTYAGPGSFSGLHGIRACLAGIKYRVGLADQHHLHALRSSDQENPVSGFLDGEFANPALFMVEPRLFRRYTDVYSDLPNDHQCAWPPDMNDAGDFRGRVPACRCTSYDPGYVFDYRNDHYAKTSTLVGLSLKKYAEFVASKVCFAQRDADIHDYAEEHPDAAEYEATTYFESGRPSYVQMRGHAPNPPNSWAKPDVGREGASQWNILRMARNHALNDILMYLVTALTEQFENVLGILEFDVVVAQCRRSALKPESRKTERERVSRSAGVAEKLLQARLGKAESDRLVASLSDHFLFPGIIAHRSAGDAGAGGDSGTASGKSGERCEHAHASPSLAFELKFLVSFKDVSLLNRHHGLNHKGSASSSVAPMTASKHILYELNTFFDHIDGAPPASEAPTPSDPQTMPATQTHVAVNGMAADFLGIQIHGERDPMTREELPPEAVPVPMFTDVHIPDPAGTPQPLVRGAPRVRSNKEDPAPMNHGQLLFQVDGPVVGGDVLWHQSFLTRFKPAFHARQNPDWTGWQLGGISADSPKGSGVAAKTLRSAVFYSAVTNYIVSRFSMMTLGYGTTGICLTPPYALFGEAFAAHEWTADVGAGTMPRLDEETSDEPGPAPKFSMFGDRFSSNMHFLFPNMDPNMATVIESMTTALGTLGPLLGLRNSHELDQVKRALNGVTHELEQQRDAPSAEHDACARARAQLYQWPWKHGEEPLYFAFTSYRRTCSYFLDACAQSAPNPPSVRDRFCPLPGEGDEARRGDCCCLESMCRGEDTMQQYVGWNNCMGNIRATMAREPQCPLSAAFTTTPTAPLPYDQDLFAETNPKDKRVVSLSSTQPERFDFYRIAHGCEICHFQCFDDERARTMTASSISVEDRSFAALARSLNRVPMQLEAIDNMLKPVMHQASPTESALLGALRQEYHETELSELEALERQLIVDKERACTHDCPKLCSPLSSRGWWWKKRGKAYPSTTPIRQRRSRSSTRDNRSRPGPPLDVEKHDPTKGTSHDARVPRGRSISFGSADDFAARGRPPTRDELQRGGMKRRSKSPMSPFNRERQGSTSAGFRHRVAKEQCHKGCVAKINEALSL